MRPADWDFIFGQVAMMACSTRWPARSMAASPGAGYRLLAPRDHPRYDSY